MVNLKVSRIMSYLSSNRQGEHLIGNFYHNLGGGHLCIKNRAKAQSGRHYPRCFRILHVPKLILVKKHIKFDKNSESPQSKCKYKLNYFFYLVCKSYPAPIYRILWWNVHNYGQRYSKTFPAKTRSDWLSEVDIAIFVKSMLCCLQSSLVYINYILIFIYNQQLKYWYTILVSRNCKNIKQLNFSYY